MSYKTYTFRAGLTGYNNFPTKLESQCEKVKKMVCTNVENKEEVMKMVEVCVRTPKEVRFNIRFLFFLFLSLKLF